MFVGRCLPELSACVGLEHGVGVVGSYGGTYEEEKEGKCQMSI
jgi:hypothetical protein